MTMGRIKLAGFIVAFVVAFFPSLILAQEVKFSVFPAKVKIDNLSPGKVAEFNLTIHNKDEAPCVFALTTFHPPDERRTKGRAKFPDDSWITFSPQEIEVPAHSQANVTVTVAIPREQEWAGRDWETWLGISSKSSDLLAIKLYVRLLVSTSAAVQVSFNAALVAGIVGGVLLLGYGGYRYFKYRTGPKGSQ